MPGTAAEKIEAHYEDLQQAHAALEASLRRRVRRSTAKARKAKAPGAKARKAARTRKA